MKTWKRALALVLALVMALSLVALPSFAEGEETGGGTESGPKWDDPGSILLNKVAQPVENKEGIYEITLTIQGKNFETNSDVVLVIDKSGSMNDDDKLLDTKKAAIAFGEKLLTKGSTTRIAIVTYAETAASINNGHFYTADELDAFKSQINGIKASGGTNQQAGIHVAQQLLDSDSPVGNLKNIVILSDGVPTYSYAITGSITCTRDAYVVYDATTFNYKYDYATMDVNWATASIVCDHNKRVGSGYGIGVKKQSGFVPAKIKGIRHADDPEADYFLIKELTPGFLDGISGTYKDPVGYFVCEKDPEGFERFEATFPKKEKRKLTGQLF